MMPPFDTLHVNKPLHFETLCALTGGCLEDLQRLNPAYLRNIIPGSNKTYILKVPLYLSEVLHQNRVAILDSAARAGKIVQDKLATTLGIARERIIHRVRSGETLSYLAQRYRVRVADIREWNNLSGTTIRIGQQLNIWVNHAPRPVVAQKETSNENSQLLNAQTYTVQEGDTLWSISRKFQGLTIEQLRKLNNLPDNRIYPGQVLVLTR